MNRYEVIFSDDARTDLIEIHSDNLANFDNPLNAIKVYEKILKRCSTLSAVPEISSVKLRHAGRDLRITHSGKYSIIYYINKKQKRVTIVDVLYSRRDIAKIINEKEAL